MAQKVNIVLVDDIDGSEATQTVTFGLDGATYEIDLNDDHAAGLRDALATYVGHGRKVGRSGAGTTRSTKAAAAAIATARPIPRVAPVTRTSLPDRSTEPPPIIVNPRARHVSR